ncbi:anhydro-N-acetylmuramic acid kinase [Cytophaga hutchinsonii ATCC 33406]|nr:anhydro-N-acetylmuramic acid kinase [Cytophaga hutchinsonii ATCC 33406]
MTSNMIHKKHTVAGLMSGTSLDGLDIAVCTFEYKNDRWVYTTVASTTIDYSAGFKQELNQAMRLPGEELILLDRSFGAFQGEEVKAFLHAQGLQVDLVAAHGHTIFHNPAKGYTLQIGSGASLYAACGIPVVCDFRSVDVAYGGQGAPLVPLGDELLFSAYSGCLNLGGIANIGYMHSGMNVAFDICAVNIVLNALSLKEGKVYDDGGRIAESGSLIPALLEKLEALPFYSETGPKSLGREWVDAVIFPLLENYSSHSNKDMMHTFVVHCGQQIAKALQGLPVKNNTRNLLITGGGAFNTFLVEQIRLHAGSQIEIVVPDTTTIQYKEAIIFAFLGLLRMYDIPNAKSTVTGASVNTIGGAVYGSLNDFFS